MSPQLVLCTFSTLIYNDNVCGLNIDNEKVIYSPQQPVVAVDRGEILKDEFYT